MTNCRLGSRAGWDYDGAVKVTAKLSVAFAVMAIFLLGAGVAAICFLEQVNPLLSEMKRHDRDLENLTQALRSIRSHPDDQQKNVAWVDDFLKETGHSERARHLALGARTWLQQAQTGPALKELEELQRQLHKATTSSHKRLVVVNRQVTLTMIIMLSGSVALLVLFFLALRFWIADPLLALKSTAASLAAGQSEVLADGLPAGEFADIGAALQQVADGRRADRAHGEQLARMAELGAACSHVTNNIRSTIGSIRTLATYEGTAHHVDPSARMAFQYIVATANKMESWIRDLHAAVSPTGLRAVRQPVEPILHDALSLVQPEINARGLQVQLAPADGLADVSIDRVLIEQALVAVLTNAIEASPPGGTIRIQTTAETDATTIAVADEGSGMSEEIKQRAFQAFYTTKPHSTGLGLTVAHAVVTRHGGDIALKTQPARGTSVVIRIPAAPKRGSQQPPA